MMHHRISWGEFQRMHELIRKIYMQKNVLFTVLNGALNNFSVHVVTADVTAVFNCLLI